MRQLRQDLARLLDRQFSNQAKLLWVESNRPGFNFADQIVPQIWLSDVLLSVYSRRAELGPQERDWVSYEVARAKRFGLPCMIVRENGVKLGEIYERLSKES